VPLWNESLEKHNCIAAPARWLPTLGYLPSSSADSTLSSWWCTGSPTDLWTFQPTFIWDSPPLPPVATASKTWMVQRSGTGYRTAGQTSTATPSSSLERVCGINYRRRVTVLQTPESFRKGLAGHTLKHWFNPDCMYNFYFYLRTHDHIVNKNVPQKSPEWDLVHSPGRRRRVEKYFLLTMITFRNSLKLINPVFRDPTACCKFDSYESHSTVAGHVTNVFFSVIRGHLNTVTIKQSFNNKTFLHTVASK